MAFKSIIDIDINDAKFKEFLESFQQYKDKAEDAPEDWHKLASAISGAGDEMRGFGRAQREALGGADRDAKRFSRNLKQVSGEQKGFVRGLKSGSSGMKNFARETGGAALGLDALAGPIGIVVAGIAAIGAAAAKATLSLDKLTASKFKSAREMGMTVAQQQSFKNYGSQLFSNPDAMLTAARNAKMNPADTVPFRALGIGQNAIAHDSTAQLAFLLAKRAHERLKETPESKRGTVWEALTQGKLGGYGQAELFAKTHMATINHYRAEYKKHEKAYAITAPAALRAVKVSQGASELKGRVVTDVENVAASQTVAKASMDTIRTARSGLADAGALYAKAMASLQAPAKAVVKTFDDVVHAGENLAKKWGVFVGSGKSAYDVGGALRDIMERDKGTSREAYAKKKYDAFAKLHPFWYEKQYNWKQQHNPMDIHSVPGEVSDFGKRVFASNAQSYRTAAQLLKHYRVPDTVQALYRHYVGYYPHPVKPVLNNGKWESVKQQKTQDRTDDAHVASIAAWMKTSATKPLNLNDPRILSGLVAGTAKWEQTHKRSYAQMQLDILRDIARNTAKPPAVHIHAKTSAGSHIAVAAHAGAR